MAAWNFVVHDLATDRELAELTAARDRRLTVRLADAHDASLTVSGRHEQSRHVGPGLTRDLIVYRDAVKLARLRILRPHDTGDSAAHTVQVSARSYRDLLIRRTVQTALSYAATEQEAIGWNLVAHTQAQTGGDLGVTRGTGQTTGITRDRDYPPGADIRRALDDLAMADDGFDWDIDPDLIWTVWHPERGEARDFTLHYDLEAGGNCTGFDRQPDPTSFGNVVIATHPGALAPEIREAADLATAPEGRWEITQAFGDSADSTELGEQADGLLTAVKRVRHTTTMTLAPGAWSGPGDLWLGDTCKCVIVSPPRYDPADGTAVDEQLRVVEMEFSRMDSMETVKVTLDRATPDPVREDREIRQRLAALER